MQSYKYIVSEFQMWVGALEVVAVSEVVARVCSRRRPAGQGSITQSSASQRAAWSQMEDRHLGQTQDAITLGVREAGGV